MPVASPLPSSPTSTTPSWYVAITQEQLGTAMPPLYEGYRRLFASLSTVTLGPHRTKNITQRVKNCAARMLCYLNYHLARVRHPEAGLQLSRTQFQDLFLDDYSIDVIELAQAVLIASGFVHPPDQTHSINRAYTWRLNTHQLQQAFSQLTATPRTAHRHTRRKNHLTLITDESPETTNTPVRPAEPSSHEQPDPSPLSDPHTGENPHGTNTAAAFVDNAPHEGNTPHGETPDTPRHDRKSPYGIEEDDHRNTHTGKSPHGTTHHEHVHADISGHGNRHMPPSTQATTGMHGGNSPDARGQQPPCTTKKGKEQQREKNDSLPSLPQEQQQEGKQDLSSDQLCSKDAQPSPEDLVARYQDCQATPDMLLAFFDHLRGYLLPPSLCPMARQAANELCTTRTIQPVTQRGFATVHTALYLLKHDPKWQANYDTYCWRTGIPDIWLVNRWIEAKWPLVKRRLLQCGDYVEWEDGTLLTREAYRQHWQEQDQPAQQEKVRTIRTGRPQQQAEPSEACLPPPEHAPETIIPAADEAAPHVVEPDDYDLDFPSASVAEFQAKLLTSVLPPYYRVTVLVMEECSQYQIQITSLCLEDDVVVLTNKREVSTVIRCMRKKRTQEREDPSTGWQEEAIALWWQAYLTEKLTTFHSACIPLDDGSTGLLLTPMGGTDPCLLINDEDVKTLLAHYQSRATHPRGRLIPRRIRTQNEEKRP